MKKDWNKLSPTDKHRLAASFFHMNADYRKAINTSVRNLLLVALSAVQRLSCWLTLLTMITFPD
jgi:hypothetical protein